MIFGTNMIQRTWSASQEAAEAAAREEAAKRWGHTPQAQSELGGGLVIRLQRIYNFLLFHAIILSLLDV